MPIANRYFFPNMHVHPLPMYLKKLYIFSRTYGTQKIVSEGKERYDEIYTQGLIYTCHEFKLFLFQYKKNCTTILM